MVTTVEALNFNLPVHVCALVITCILLMGAILSGNITGKIYRWFFALLVSNIIGIACEVVIGFLLLGEVKGIDSLLYLLDYISYIAAPIQNIIFVLYLYEYLQTQTVVSKRLVGSSVVLSFVSIVVITIGKALNLYGYFDENYVYQQGEFFALSYLVTAITLVIFAVIAIRSRKDIRRREWLSLLSYPAIAFSAYIVETLFEDLWVAYLSVSLICFIIYINIQIELKQQMEIKDRELAEQRIAIMLSQIRPHFLYNTLTTIGDLCVTDPKQAQETVVEFSDYLRANMSSLSSDRLIPFANELHHVKTYLSLEQKRFGERLSISYDICADNFFIPPLTVQPIVENAVIHGITVRRETGTVSVSTEETPLGFCITVTDDGVGFDMSKPLSDNRPHLGIDNVKKRLAATCGGTLEVTSVVGKGTTAIIFIPKGTTR